MRALILNTSILNTVEIHHKTNPMYHEWNFTVQIVIVTYTKSIITELVCKVDIDFVSEVFE